MTTPKKEPITSSPFIKRVRSKVSASISFFGGIALLGGLFLLCEYAVESLSLSFPPALIGIAILLLILLIIGRVPKILQPATGFLLSHMVVFFIPAIAGIVAYITLILAFPLALLLSIVASTVLSLLITALLSQKLLPKDIDNE
ncbi:CidA/LrgA family protein [Glaciecola siphonariae]|uniref:CidA/LrgA family protein n=1 Tax=Glaciecola siphonariae TaxID=521012 RepID=A0ABV9M0F4_9ALTE